MYNILYTLQYIICIDIPIDNKYTLACVRVRRCDIYYNNIIVINIISQESVPNPAGDGQREREKVDARIDRTIAAAAAALMESFTALYSIDHDNNI